MDLALIGEEFKVGVPVAFMNSVTAVGVLLLQYFVNLLGVNYTAAYAACSRITEFMMQPCGAAGMAMSTFAGQNLGAGKIDRIKQGLKCSFGIAVTLALITGCLLLFAPGQLASLMLSDQENYRSFHRISENLRCNDVVDQFPVPDKKYLSGEGIYRDTDGIGIFRAGGESRCRALAGSVAWIYGDRDCGGQRVDCGAAFKWNLSSDKTKAAVSDKRRRDASERAGCLIQNK